MANYDDLEDITQVLRTKKTFYHLKNFVLFGSFANGTNKSDSDIDIAYIENEKSRLNFDNYLKLESELKSIFNRKIDLINYKKFNPLVKLSSKKEFIYV